MSALVGNFRRHVLSCRGSNNLFNGQFIVLYNSEVPRFTVKRLPHDQYAE